MLTLSSKQIEIQGFNLAEAERLLFRVREPSGKITDLGPNDACLVKETVPADFKGPLLVLQSDRSLVASSSAQIVFLPDEFSYLADGDVVGITNRQSRASLRVLYRRKSLQNSFLLTERCNHYCLMCSQPPRDINDDWIVDELADAIPLISKETLEIGLTGGEPTLLGDKLLHLLSGFRDHLPNTAIHILSNGRRFAEMSFARAYATIRHFDMMVGIPIYSDISQIHDYIVQADGAFDETVRGILNLKSLGQKVEVRVVVHRQNYERLPELAEFFARNLTFVDHIALMGLEMTGFAKANIEQLWIDPFDYREKLYQAARILDDFRLPVSIYNHQLCTLDKRIWHLSRQSISDWKNEYRSECNLCQVRNQCAGFFATGRLRQSSHISPVTSPTID